MTRASLWSRRVALVLSFVAVLAAVVPAAPAEARSRSARQKELSRLIHWKRGQIAKAQAKERDILGRLHASDLRKAELTRQLGIIEGELSSARSELGVLETRLDQLDAMIRLKTAQLEAARAQLAAQTQQLNARAASLYMFDTQPSWIPGVTNDLSDAIAAQGYSASVLNHDGALVEAITATKKTIETQRAEIEQTQAQVRDDRAAAAQQAQRIVDARTQHSVARNAVQAEIKTKQGLLSQVRKEKAAYERALQSYITESANIAAFLRGKQRGQHVIAGIGNWLRWPISGRITSPFGWRIHPIYHRRSFHTGIDIAAPMGTLVRAARYGTVLYTGYKGAFGNVVLIDHGNGIATMYAHLSRFYVHAGQSVDRLQGIAAVGTTGWSTGPHLHFEVRSNGTPTNPIRWL